MSDRPVTRRALPAWLTLPLVIAACYLVLGLLTRLVLYGVFAQADHMAAAELPLALLQGAVNDLYAQVFLLLPVSLALLLLSRRFVPARARHIGMLGLLGGVLFAMLFAAVAEFVYFEEFDSRFGLVAVDYLRYPTEVLVNIQQSYPILPIVVSVATAALGLLWAIHRRLGVRTLQRAARGGGLVLLATNLVLIAGLLAGHVRGAPSSSEDRVAQEIASNGAVRFVEALRTNELDFRRYYVNLPEAEVRRIVEAELGFGGVTLRPEPDGTVVQRVPARPDGLGHRNVVVIVEESLGAEHVGILGGADLTPNLDRLAGQGILFTSAYATGTRTVRGLEAINLSVPPAPGESLLKRPGSTGLRSWPEVMQDAGYRTSFLYGGYAYFDGMADFFGGNGMRILDRAELPPPRFANAWGVSDEDLFEGALAHLDAETASGQPVFALILTTSNHRPYTFPPGVPGVPEEGGGRSAGVRYADHALGRFMDAAATRPWYADTVFVVLGDHGARVYGADEIPVHSYRIPILVIAPGAIPARTMDLPVSQIDLAPTVLGLLGLAWEAPFFGRDVLAHGAAQRPVFLQHNYSVGLLEGEHMAILGLRRRTGTYHYDRSGDRLVPEPADEALIARTTALYQSAYDLYLSHRTPGG